LQSTVTNIFVPSGLSARPSPPEPITIVRVPGVAEAGYNSFYPDAFSRYAR
jgi:hypothetical protein